MSSFSYDGKNVEVWKLPEIKGGLSWPSFWYDEKQSMATCPHLLYVRIDETSKKRRDAIMETLQEGSSTVVVGSAGSGKSSEMNIILVQLIQKMSASQGNWPKAIFFRYPDLMIRFVQNGNNIDINVEVSKDLYHVKDVAKFAKQIYPNKAVLLLEMRELVEVDPQVSIPTNIALSPRDAEDRVKTMSKNGADFLIAPPPDKEQVVTMAQYQLDCLRPGFGLPSIAPSVTEVLARTETIGPLLRYVLASPKVYERRKEAVESSAKQFFEVLKDINVFNIPKEAGKYIAVVLKGTEPVYGAANWKFAFLSDFAMEVVQNATLTDAQVRALESLGVKYLVAEYAARQYFKGEWDFDDEWVPSNQQFDLNDCDVCIDAGFEGLINTPKNAQHKTALMKLLPRWDSEVVFDGMYLEKEVKLLRQGCLYRPRFHHFALGDAVVVDHKAKKVFFIQSTAQDVADHSIKLSTLEKVMTKLGLLDGGDNGDYTLWIIFCADWSRALTHGSCFTTPVDYLLGIQSQTITAGPVTDAPSKQKSRGKAAGKKQIKFYKHSCIAEDGTINYDAFKVSTSKKDSGQTLKLEDPSQYLSPKEIAIVKRCHVLIVRCQYLPALNKYELN